MPLKWILASQSSREMRLKLGATREKAASLSVSLKQHSPSPAFLYLCFILLSLNVLDSHYLTAVMFSKIDTNNQIRKQWAITPRGNTGLGSCKPLVIILLPTDVYFCFKAPYWICTVDSLTLNSQPTALQSEGSLSNTCIFSVRSVTAFLSLGTLDSTSGLCLAVILNSEITNKKHTNVKNVALNKLWKWHLL